jgi:hypothetical protein
MIVCKIFLDNNVTGDEKISFRINQDISEFYCMPAGRYIDKVWGEGLRYSSSVIGFDKIAISPEARTALFKNLTKNVDPGRFQNVGRIGVFAQKIDVPDMDKRQICVTWRPINPETSCNLDLEVDSQCPIEIDKGFDPEMLMKISNVMDNEYLKNTSYSELNKTTPTM